MESYSIVMCEEKKRGSPCNNRVGCDLCGMWGVRIFDRHHWNCDPKRIY
jgi:hypothetical protein